ncbi:MAG: hypothetical protein CL807_02195 [Citromicrobium sp.]|nr:hypothetical protein [Citromicrobium sp.]MBD75711.1 hypothetical protein [Citromicrobium sp.]MBT46731.1 hypothetical protein [Citromicrobium sp.]
MSDSSIHRTHQAGTAQRATLLAGAFGAAFLCVPAQAQDHKDPDIIVIGQRDVNENAEPEAPYKAESSDGKFTDKVLDTPKTQTVIPKEVIEDIGANSFREIVRSTPGVTLGTGEGGNAFGDRIFIRGFEARNDVYIDGLRDPGVTSREIFAIEQIEVIKGPSAVFGGRGTTGGLVSLQSKRAQFGNDFIVAEGGIGTENYYRGTVDANYQLADGAAIRINGLYHDADTPGRDYVENERYGGSIAGTLAITDTLSINADYYLYRLDGVPDYGHPFDSTTQQPYQVDRDNFYGVVGRDFISNGADIGTVGIEWNPIPDLSIYSTTRYGETWNRYAVSEPSLCVFERDPTTNNCPRSGGVPVPESEYTVSPAMKSSWRDNSYWANSTYAVAKAQTGGIAHEIVMGGDYSFETIDAYRLDVPTTVEDAQGNIISIPGSFVWDLFDPNPVLGYDIEIGPDTATGPSVTEAQSFGAYLVDTIKFSEAFRVVLGGRLDSFDIDYRSSSGQTLDYSATLFNWQASGVFKPSPATTLYVSYATSANPSGEQLDGNGASYDGISSDTIDFSPEKNTSWEAGAKAELFGGNLLLTAAAFRIEKDNARESGGRGQPYTNVGTLRSQGVELGFAGTVADRIKLFGGYTYTDATITESANPANVGRRFANIPEHTAQLLATVLVTSRFEIGGQVYYQDEMYGGSQLAGTAMVPGYARFDAVARYRVNDHLTARVNVLNVTDKRYYDAIYRSGSPFSYIAPGRSAFFTLTADF